VKNYLRTTFDKLGVWSRLELALYVASHGGVNWVSELGLTEKVSESRGNRCKLGCLISTPNSLPTHSRKAVQESLEFRPIFALHLEELNANSGSEA